MTALFCALGAQGFSRIDRISDAWVPQARLWVGEYYLLRPAFEALFAAFGLNKASAMRQV